LDRAPCHEHLLGKRKEAGGMHGALRSVSDQHACDGLALVGHPDGASFKLGDVRIWFVAFDGPIAQSDVALLDEKEIGRCRALVRASDQLGFVSTRATLRRVLAFEMDVLPQAVRVVRDEWGKPHLCASHRRPDLEFSVSHTDGIGVIAVSRSGAVGVDIERCRAVPEKLKITAEVFGEDVAARLSSFPLAGRDAVFLRLWSGGEAYLKAIGTGFAGRHLPIPIGIAPDLTGRIMFSMQFPDRDSWRLASLDVAPGYVCSVASAHAM
jgi:4'-phosphopantetheinyl transferase